MDRPGQAKEYIFACCSRPTTLGFRFSYKLPQRKPLCTLHPGQTRTPPPTLGPVNEVHVNGEVFSCV